jgi:hypothetical protein
MSDWQARINDPNVVWYHNFESPEEVFDFHYSGHDWTDENIRWNSSDGFAGGGCIELFVPVNGVGNPHTTESHGGQITPGVNPNASWNRPFSPIRGTDNGRGIDDPGANGTLSPQAWPHHSGYVSTPQLAAWKKGWYADASYWDHPTRGTPAGFSFDGTEFYIQFRVKISANRFRAGQPDGKLFFVSMTGTGRTVMTPDQELVIQSTSNPLFRHYTNFGSVRSNAIIAEVQGNGAVAQGSYQPGSSRYFDWAMPADEWVTFLYYFKPGLDGSGPTGGDDPNMAIAAKNGWNNTTMRIWVAKQSEIDRGRGYTKIFDKSDLVWAYGPDSTDIFPKGMNAIIATSYMNDVGATSEFYHRYTQFIFSKAMIPCPRA